MARMIRDYTRSLRMSKLSVAAECLFIRLLLCVDDYGNHLYNADVLKAECYPLRPAYRRTDIILALEEMIANGLVVAYEADQKAYIHLLNFNQKLRYPKRKHPPSPFEFLNLPPDARKKESTTRPTEQSFGREERKEVEVEVEVEVVVVVKSETAIQPDNDTLMKIKCFDFCKKHFHQYFPKENNAFNKACEIALARANEDLALKPTEKEKIEAAFKNQESALEKSMIGTAIKKELELFWAFNDAKDVPINKRFKNLKLWLLRKK